MDRRDADWSAYRSAGVRVDTRVDDTEIERGWIEKMLRLELEKRKIFDKVIDMKEGAPPSDLHVFVTITRIKRWLTVKIFVDIEFIDAKTKAHLGRKRMITKSSKRIKGLRNRHKAAGQVALRIARRVVLHIQERR